MNNDCCIGMTTADKRQDTIRFALEVNRALWECWEEDFAVLPFLHRSPLDAANGIRGTEMFLDMFEAPERVTALADWCADWSISLERHVTTARSTLERIRYAD